MKKVVINGRVFEFPITGVGRFCYEVICELDKIVPPHSCELAVSATARNIPVLKNIEVRQVGHTKGILWEQVTLLAYLLKTGAVALNMSNSAPIFRPGYVVLHDISLKVNRKKVSGLWESLKIHWPLLQYRIFSRFARKIFTVSEFQKREIMKYYGMKPQKIVVVYNGWQHMNRIASQDDAAQKYSHGGNPFFFAMSTRAKNKNFRWIYETARNNPDFQFVVAGNLSPKYFQDTIVLEKIPNIKAIGFAADGEIKALMRSCTAFLYPSTYEGFGIPPLEALSVGAKAVVAWASCLPEIYGDSVYYIDPNDYTVDLRQLLTHKTGDRQKILDCYSWEKTARLIWSNLGKVGT